jgi:hypothetical protein
MKVELYGCQDQSDHHQHKGGNARNGQTKCSFLLPRQQCRHLEIDPKAQNGRNPDGSGNRLFAILDDKPQIGRHKERDHDGQQNGKI